MKWSPKADFMYVYDAFMRYASFFGSLFFIGFIFAFLYSIHQDSFAVRLLCASIVFLIIEYTTKAIVGRVRPDFKTNHPHSVFGRFEEKHSFPSGHSGYSSLLTMMVALNYANVLLTALLVVITFCVGMSRMYLKRHYVTDVLVGWTLGALIGYVSFAVI